MTTPASRLAALRQVMKNHHLDAWIIPSADPHLSEYLPEHWESRSWLSGFTGSVGTLAITQDEATLWTDSRYWEQAPIQLSGSGIELKKLTSSSGTHAEWLAQILAPNTQVGVAPDMLSLAEKRHLQEVFAKKSITLQHNQDIIDEIYTDRPPLPHAPIYAHKVELVAESCAEKLARIRTFMSEKGADFHLISSLDDIAWLTNLRGDDVPYNPVFLSHLLIDKNTATLFVEKSKLSDTLISNLNQAGVELADYHSITDALSQLSGALLLDPKKVAISTLNKLPGTVRLIEHMNPSTLFKSIKSASEIENIRQAMIQDGVALCGFFAEFEQKLADNAPLNELDITDMLIHHRSQRPNYISPSFETICGFKGNGAVVHYSATPDSFSEIKGDGLLLIDSGAQYENGTTDITRVVGVGNISDAEKRDYTLVLKAHISLAQAVFPVNTPAPMLDALCRAPMWKEACNYGHGTGHGVGYFLNVHEGPQTIAYFGLPNAHQAMKEGMLTSNEPGLYRSGKWGIRIESLVVNQPVANPKEHEFGDFLYFETVTLCPIDTRLIDKSLMTENEINWLNAYHATVRQKLESLTEGTAKDWLIERTQAI